MNKYEIRCTTKQTMRALSLGAPIERQEFCSKEGLPNEWFAKGDKCYHIPTAEEMVGWLEEQGVFVDICYDCNSKFYYPLNAHNQHISNLYPSRKQATIASIDSALLYLERSKRSHIISGSKCRFFGVLEDRYGREEENNPRK